MASKNSAKSPIPDNTPKNRTARYIKSLRPLARRLVLPAAQVYADLRLRPRNWKASITKTLALARCVNLCSSRALLNRYRDRLIHEGHVCPHFADPRSAAVFAVVFASLMDPAHVAQRDAKFLRALLKLIAESFGGVRWAQQWLNCPCPDLGGRSPQSLAADAAGFGAAAKVLAAVLRRRGS